MDSSIPQPKTAPEIKEQELNEPQGKVGFQWGGYVFEENDTTPPPELQQIGKEEPVLKEQRG